MKRFGLYILALIVPMLAGCYASFLGSPVSARIELPGISFSGPVLAVENKSPLWAVVYGVDSKAPLAKLVPYGKMMGYGDLAGRLPLVMKLFDNSSYSHQVGIAYTVADLRHGAVATWGPTVNDIRFLNGQYASSYSQIPVYQLRQEPVEIVNVGNLKQLHENETEVQIINATLHHIPVVLDGKLSEISPGNFITWWNGGKEFPESLLFVNGNNTNNSYPHVFTANAVDYVGGVRVHVGSGRRYDFSEGPVTGGPHVHQFLLGPDDFSR